MLKKQSKEIVWLMIQKPMVWKRTAIRKKKIKFKKLKEARRKVSQRGWSLSVVDLVSITVGFIID